MKIRCKLELAKRRFIETLSKRSHHHCISAVIAKDKIPILKIA